MYEAFYSLEDPPFVLTPDPRFLLRSKGHHEILATLLYGITSQKGLMALVGDVGTGKTTLCRALLRELPDNVQSALVLNPHLSDADLIGTILDDLGVERRGTTKGELMTTLSQYLLAAGSEGKTVLVIVDEAQQMSVESLEQIRILSNLETADPQAPADPPRGPARARGEAPAQRAAPARPADRHPLLPQAAAAQGDLSLRRAPPPRRRACRGRCRSPAGRWRRSTSTATGIPRVINLVCDRSLMAGFSNRVREITPDLVTSSVRNLEGGRQGRNRYVRMWSPRSRRAARRSRRGRSCVFHRGSAAASGGSHSGALLRALTSSSAADQRGSVRAVVPVRSSSRRPSGATVPAAPAPARSRRLLLPRLLLPARSRPGARSQSRWSPIVPDAGAAAHPPRPLPRRRSIARSPRRGPRPSGSS